MSGVERSTTVSSMDNDTRGLKGLFFIIDSHSDGTDGLIPLLMVFAVDDSRSGCRESGDLVPAGDQSSRGEERDDIGLGKV